MLVQIKNVSKSFVNKKVLDSISFDIGEHEIVGIIGRSGSGKSTLLNIVGLLESKDSGEINLFNTHNPKINSRATRGILRNHIAYLFQDYALLEGESVNKNLLIACRYSKFKDNKKEIATVLEQVGLAGFEARLVYTLSGGEQQRVALARCLLKPCDLILADEPTGNLDINTRNEILDLFRQLKTKKSMLIVTHDPAMIPLFDKVIEL